MATKEAIDAAILAHSQWRNRLHDAITKGTSEFKVENVEKDYVCDFGKWLYSLPPSEKNTETFQKVKDLHAAFHKEAANVLKLALLGKKSEAEKSMLLGGGYNGASSKLVLELNKWKDKK